MWGLVFGCWVGFFVFELLFSVCQHLTHTAEFDQEVGALTCWVGFRIWGFGLRARVLGLWGLEFRG